jgi:2-methylcitrate dehydratase PrpD
MAAATSAGHNQAWVDGSDEWLFEVAGAARSGLDAARVALSGAKAASGAFEGKAGWCAAYFDDPGGPVLAMNLADSSDRTARSAMKLYPVSGIAQTPTHLAAQLGKEFAADDIQRVQVRMSANEVSYPGTSNRGPFRSRSDTLMSVPRCVAIALRRGATPYEVLLAPVDADQADLMDRVELVPEEDFEDGTVQIVVEMAGGDKHHRDAKATDFLFPHWSDVTADLAGLAQRTECPLETVNRLADVLSGDPTAEEINAVVEMTE